MRIKDSQSFVNALKISVYYLLFGCAWIYFSDSAVELLSLNDLHQLTLFQNYKGWFFIALTACLLFILVYRLFRKAFTQYTERINEQAAAHRRLAQQDALLSTIVNSSPDAVFAKDMEGRYILFNKGAGKLVNIAPEKVIGKTDDILFAPEAAQKIQEMDRLTIAGGTIHNHEEDLTTSGDINKSFWVTKGPLLAENGETFGIFGISRDITEQKMVQTRLEEQNALLNSLINGSPDAIVIKGLDRRYIVFNEAAAQLSGVTVDEALGKTADEIFPPETAKSIKEFDDELLEKKSFDGHETTLLMPNGTRPVYWVTKGLLSTEKGNLFGIFGIYRNITQFKMNEQAIIDAKEHYDYMAHHDYLTNLPNRLSLIEMLNNKMSSTKKAPFALLFFDLDGFKEINDSYGHPFGDTLLIRFTGLLSDIFDQKDMIIRTGGDEFVVVSASTDHGTIKTTLEALIEKLSLPFLINNTEVYITASIGIAFYPQDAETVEDILKYADAAMYNAKKSGKNTYSFFDDQLTKTVLERTVIATNLQKAIANRDLSLYFQPQINPHTGAIMGIEALVRWFYNGEMIPPAQFIPIAEERGLIIELGTFILEEGFSTAAFLAQEGILPKRIAINVSARQLTHPDFLSQLLLLLEKTSCNPDWIELEITESSILEQPEKMIALLKLLKSKGFEISIDDFGTGYSSLSYLKNLPIDKLKIDISFIRNITHESKNQTIVKTIIALTEGLGICSLAEGVESAEELRFLIENGIDSVQGFYYHHPIHKEALIDLLRKEPIESGMSENC